jgi:hypothetical protein
MGANPYESPTTASQLEPRGPVRHESTASLVWEMLGAWAVLVILLALQLPGLSAHDKVPPSFAGRAVQIVLFGCAGAVALFFTGRLIVRVVRPRRRRQTGNDQM